MDNRIVDSAKLIVAAKLLHRLAMERLDEAKRLLALDNVDVETVDFLQKESHQLFDAEGTVLDRIKVIHDSLRDKP